MKKLALTMSMLLSLGLLASCGEAGAQGAPGEIGPQGEQGQQGQPGLSAFDIYKQLHPEYKGTLDEWMNAMIHGGLEEQNQEFNVTVNYMGEYLTEKTTYFYLDEYTINKIKEEANLPVIGFKDQDGKVYELDDYGSLNIYLVKDTILTPIFGDIFFKATFDVNGGKAMDPITYEYDKPMLIPTPVKEGYEFAGWVEKDVSFFSLLEGGKYDENGEWKSLINYNNTNYPYMKDIELTAIWTKVIDNASYIFLKDEAVIEDYAIDESEGKIDKTVKEFTMPLEIEGKKIVGSLYDAFSGFNFEKVTIPQGIRLIGDSFDEEILKDIYLPSKMEFFAADLDESIKNKTLKVHMKDAQSLINLGFEINYPAELYLGDSTTKATSIEVKEEKDAEFLADLSHFEDIVDFALPGNIWPYGFSSKINKFKFTTENEYFTSKNSKGEEINGIIDKVTGKLIKATNATVISDDIKIIGSYAFNDLSVIDEINIPSNVQKIEEDAFSNLPKLEKITLNSGLISIDDYAFNNIYKLTSITIPDTVTHLGKHFISNVKIEKLIVDPKNKVYSSGDGANAILNKDGTELFIGIKNTLIPSSVKTIKSRAFSGDLKYDNIFVPSSVEEIEEYAFDYAQTILLEGNDKYGLKYENYQVIENFKAKNIDDIMANKDKKYNIVEAEVVSSAGSNIVVMGTNGEFYNVYASHLPELAVGDKVIMNGQYNEYNNIKQFKATDIVKIMKVETPFAFDKAKATAIDLSGVGAALKDAEGKLIVDKKDLATNEVLGPIAAQEGKLVKFDAKLVEWTTNEGTTQIKIDNIDGINFRPSSYYQHELLKDNAPGDYTVYAIVGGAQTKSKSSSVEKFNIAILAVEKKAAETPAA